MEPVQPSVGWGVLHLFYSADREVAEHSRGSAKQLVAAVEALEADGHQALVFAVLGHKADLGVMALGPDLARLHAFQQELAGLPLTLEWSYVSLTELSEYTSTEDDERASLDQQGVVGRELEERLEAWRQRMAEYAEHRTHPKLPAKRVICFYPMSKLRTVGANWFELSFEERKRLMGGHGRLGRTYAGRVVQLITGSTGLDDWEWGVTLLADDPVTIKDIVYEMRFDEASARFAEFGPFVTGLVLPPADAFAQIGLA